MASVDDIAIPARAARLKQARRALYPTAAKAAKALGINPVTVRAHEAGQNGFPVETAELYAKSYGVTVSWLLLGEGGDAPTPAQPPRPQGAGIILYQMPSGRVRLEINKVVPFSVALQVLALIEGAEK